jgi:DNA-binding NtrC family response regulator
VLTDPDGSRKPRVLLIDDDEVISRALFQHLLARGIATDVALDPSEAERLLRANEYLLVLLDTYLTGQVYPHGIDLVDRVRRLQPACYVILLTAYGSAELARSTVHARLTVVGKPKSISFVAELIEGLLAQSLTPEEETQP